jgi:hypothetical protein
MHTVLLYVRTSFSSWLFAVLVFGLQLCFYRKATCQHTLPCVMPRCIASCIQDMQAAARPCCLFFCTHLAVAVALRAFLLAAKVSGAAVYCTGWHAPYCHCYCSFTWLQLCALAFFPPLWQTFLHLLQPCRSCRSRALILLHRAHTVTLQQDSSSSSSQPSSRSPLGSSSSRGWSLSGYGELAAAAVAPPDARPSKQQVADAVRCAFDGVLSMLPLLDVICNVFVSCHDMHRPCYGCCHADPLYLA